MSGSAFERMLACNGASTAKARSPIEVFNQGVGKENFVYACGKALRDPTRSPMPLSPKSTNTPTARPQKLTPRARTKMLSTSNERTSATGSQEDLNGRDMAQGRAN
jgi:hypothetical protein